MHAWYKIILQVYRCLQPFMMCMSASSTHSIIDQVAQDYDSDVQSWRDKLKELLDVSNTDN